MNAIKTLVTGPFHVDHWKSSDQLVIQSHWGSTDLALVLNGNFESDEQRKIVADYIASILNAETAFAYTADGFEVNPGDKVFVRGSTGIHETTVKVPVTSYEYFGPIPVSSSYYRKDTLEKVVYKKK